mmetsp:Transcript_44112/g.122727  ORF Transcript_44112/g.122727 Transcript_44112/m.122727 type:complete len:84 (+) Transcript_44112:80-331(+)
MRMSSWASWTTAPLLCLVTAPTMVLAALASIETVAVVVVVFDFLVVLGCKMEFDELILGEEDIGGNARIVCGSTSRYTIKERW